MAKLDLPDDYQDLLREFLACGVEFVVVGGWAVAAHGHGRATDDLDLLVRATASNAANVFTALERFGAPLKQHGVTEGLFSQERYGYRIGRAPLLIEVLTTIDGVTFDEAASDALVIEIDDLKVPVIGRHALLRNKRSAGRHKDLADVESLEALDEHEGGA